ncbi:sulfatase-like hydrolase/transferase [Brevundimonas vesicularis]|uniref:sulfatase-like hydrolase/transferase n=1 Tax=Brevundimonas vesicularis TaxID=41276 RepID=UPI0038D4A30B
MHSDSVLFLSLDSCRYDSFVQAAANALKSVAPVRQAKAPSHFTYGSHAAMFVGFTPGVAEEQTAMINPKYGRLFRLNYAGHPGLAQPGFLLSGNNIIEGFRNAGHKTIGTAAMGWFDPATSVSQTLRQGFDHFYFAGHDGVARQVEWIQAQIADLDDHPAFVFINVGETHVPYHFEGAAWSRDDNPCKPFQTEDRSAECRERQIACIEYVDGHLADLIQMFRGATIVMCADHGDCWGEDGLWEHGISHEMTLTVPLAIRYRGTPV